MKHEATLRIYASDDRGLFCKYCGRSQIGHRYIRGVGFVCTAPTSIHEKGMAGE